MSKSNIGWRKAGIASLATTALVSTSVLTAGSAFAVPGFELQRIGGEDRYETSALVAEEYGDKPDAIIANGEPGNFADALAANTLAGEMDAPVLLTRAKVTPDFVKTQLKQMGAQTITVVGGETRVSAAQVADLEADGYTVNRVAGDNRFLTNAEIIEDGGQATDGLGLIATGFNFPDALAAGPISYQGHPLGLSSQDDIDDDVIAALKNAGVDQVLIFGGENAVGTEVEVKLAANGITVRDRFAGLDRTETSTEAADYAIAQLGFVEDSVNIASGRNESFGADALSGGPLTGRQMRPLLITQNEDDARDVDNWIMENNDTLETGIIFGGPAAVSLALETELEEAGQGEARAAVDVNSASVEAGQDVTGSITGANIKSATVSGPCVQNGDVTDTDKTTDGIQFSIPTNNNADAGTCTLTFTTTFDDGSTQTDTVDVTVTEPTSATSRPELLRSEIVSTTVSGQQTPSNPLGTTVRYTFDEAVIGGTAAPRATNFHVYDNAGTQYTADPDGVSRDGSSVVVRYTAIDTAEEAKTLTVATVDRDAVTDQQGDVNPEGDAAIGTQGGGNTALPAGVTAAPDLVSVGNFRQGADAGTTAVDFTFDEAATDTATVGGYHLILTENPAGATAGNANDLVATGEPTPAGSAASGGTTPGGNGTTTLTVIFTNPDAATPITADSVARGTVDKGTVTDGDATPNPLQAADVSNGGNTFEPDLVSVDFRPGNDADPVDRVLYTFDAPVATATPGNFQVYDVEGNETAGLNATVNPNNRQQVLVEFNDGVGAASKTALDRAVGASVDDGAVATATTATAQSLSNEQDEIGVANSVAIAAQTPGRTAGPDLTGVSIGRATSDLFGNQGDYQATYTFDEAVGAATAGNFFLYLADGTRLTATAANCTPGTGENDNTVTCTAYGAATQEQIASATLGTVDDGAVTATTAAGGETNPEGAEFTTGGTGTRTN